MESSGSTPEAVTGKCSPGKSGARERGKHHRGGEVNEQSRGACSGCGTGSKVTLHGRSGETSICKEVEVKREGQS